MKLEWDVSELDNFARNLENTYNFETAMINIAQRVARVLHKHLLTQTPIKTGNLRKMWSAGDNLLFTVERVKNGFQVTFINTAQNDKGFQYGLAVNDGHYSYNQYGGSYGYVQGRFFVETAIALTGETQLQKIIMDELRKWWDGV